MLALDPNDAALWANPLVSVSITAYNSEAWLARAVESVLQQKTSFPFEIVIGDDYSKDGTLQIALAWQKRYPHIVRALDRGRNLGMQRNFYDTFENCRGKYIAWLDADDYWIDPDKLTIQVDLLEADPSVSVCGHYVRQVTATGEILHEKRPLEAPGRYTLEHILQSNFIPSPTIMFRNGIHRTMPAWFFDLTGLADWPILFFAGLQGDLVLIDRVMSAYVLTPGSAYMSRNALYQDSIDLEFCEQMESVLPPKWHRTYITSKVRRYAGISYLQAKQGDFAAARETVRKALQAPHPLDNIFVKAKMLATLALCGPVWRARRVLRQT